MTRKIGLPTILAVAVLGVILVRAVAAGDAAQPGPSKMTTVVLRVQGMESAVCEIGVKTALGSLDGVKGVTVDRDGGRAEVSIDPAVVSPAALVEAVLAIGFEASLPDGGGGRAAAVAESRPRRTRARAGRASRGRHPKSRNRREGWFQAAAKA